MHLCKHIFRGCQSGNLVQPISDLVIFLQGVKQQTAARRAGHGEGTPRLARAWTWHAWHAIRTLWAWPERAGAAAACTVSTAAAAGARNDEEGYRGVNQTGERGGAGWGSPWGLWTRRLGSGWPVRRESGGGSRRPWTEAVANSARTEVLGDGGLRGSTEVSPAQLQDTAERPEAAVGHGGGDSAPTARRLCAGGRGPERGKGKKEMGGGLSESCL